MRGVCSRLDLDAAQLTPFVGRESEVAALLARWEETKAEGGRAVLVCGDAGIGKSRLVQVLRARLADAPHTWLECTAEPAEEIVRRADGVPLFLSRR